MKRIDINFNKIYYSNSNGSYKIINEEESSKGIRRVRIKFIDTGNERVIALGHALSGEIKDLYKPAVYGIGYMGNARSSNQLYVSWSCMMTRCYGKNDPSYSSYGMIGVRVEERWHCFEYFAEDAKLLPGYDKYINDPRNYQLDKDYLQLNIPKSQRIYSRNTCVFISGADNNNLHALEHNRDNINAMQSKYIGVTKSSPNTWSSVIRINSRKYYIGTFNSEVAAANAYNYFSNKYGKGELIKLHNECEYMSPAEFINYNTHTKIMFKNV